MCKKKKREKKLVTLLHQKYQHKIVYKAAA